MNKNRETLMKFISAQNQKVQDDISKQGYKDNSPYRNNPFNIIQGQPGQPTSITMKGVSTPLIGMDEYGNKQYMQPGQEYQFPGSQVTETPMYQRAGTVRDSVAHQADKILKYEVLRGGPGSAPLDGTNGNPDYRDPKYRKMLMDRIYPEVQKIMPKASAMEISEAMDFVFNAGWDKVNNKIEKDPRGFALQEYYKKYDPSKLDDDGKWTGRKNAPYSFDQEYNNTIGKLSENQRRILMNKGRDWYYQNINNPAPGVPSSDYYDTWYGRIWNTNDYKPFDPNNPMFTPKKVNGGTLLNKTIKCSNCGWSWKAADGGNDVSTCHKCGAENKIMENGGPTSNIKNWFAEQMQSSVYRRNLEKSGYKDVDAEIAKRLSNIDKTKYIADENRLGTYYNPGSRYIHHAPLKDIENWEGNAPESEYILAHEFGHSGVAKVSGTRLNKYDIEQLGSRNKNKKSYPWENYADLKAAQYEAAKLGIYNPGTEEFTQEHLDLLKKNGNIDRLFENYDDKDIIWLQNNLAQNDNNKYELPVAQFGLEGSINKSLGNPMQKAHTAAYQLAGKWYNPKTKQWEENDPVDNFRHPMAGRYVSEEIQNKLYNIPVVSQIAGMVGSNALGVGHELSTLFNPKDKRGWYDKIRESGEDIFNNAVGATVGSLPISDKQKTKILTKLSNKNMLPDGVSGTGGDMYIKHAMGGSIPKAQEGMFKSSSIPQADYVEPTYSYPVRKKLYSGEDEFFKANPNVRGMATEDNQVIINPYSSLTDEEKQGIIINESARLAMRNGYKRPTFDLTPEQKEFFNTINDGKPYSTDEQDIKETIIGRILSGDDSAGNVTPEQKKYAEELQRVLKFQEGGTKKQVKYGTPEYTEAYNKGEVITDEGVRSPIALDEVVIQNNYKRPRGFWEQSIDKYVKDNKDAGLFGALGSVVTYPLSVGQHTLTYGTTGKVQDPSEAWGHNTNEGWFDSAGAFGRNLDDALLNVLADPANLIGAGILTKGNALSKLNKLRNISTSIAPELRQGLRTAGPSFESSVDNVTNISKNLEDLNYAKDWAKQYGYELPQNLERIAQSDELTNRTLRGMMNRHNTFVRGVSTNWDVIAEKNPEILRHLEGKGFDLSTKEGTKAAAEYMATHVPIQTGYGRASLNQEVFERGQDAIYTSNSIPTAEGYTYGQGYITKVKRPTDFSSSNRQDWITQNNPEYYKNALPSERALTVQELESVVDYKNLDNFLKEGRIDRNQYDKLSKYYNDSQNIKTELYKKYNIDNLPKSISDFTPEQDKLFDAYMEELNAEKKRINYNANNTHIGQVNYNSSAYQAIDITPTPSQGDTVSTRNGASFKLSSGYLKFQFYHQSSTTAPIRLKIQIVKVMGIPESNMNTFFQQCHFPTSFLSTTIYDFNSQVNPDYFRSYKIIKTKYVSLPPDTISGVQIKKDITISLKFKNHNVKFNQESTKVSNC